MDVTRGDIVTVALRGDQGKPRPALVVQADLFHALSAVTVLPLTGTVVPAFLLRVTVEPTVANGLTRTSQVMVDEIQTPSRNHVGAVVGRLDAALMRDVERALALFLGLG